MKKSLLIVCALLVFTLGACSASESSTQNIDVTMTPEEQKYQKAEEYFEAGDFEDARIYYQELNGYEDSGIKQKECVIAIAKQLMDSGDYQGTIDYLSELREYSEASELISKCYLELGKQEYQNKKYEKAKKLLEKSRETEASTLSMDCDYQNAIALYKKKKYKKAKEIFAELDDYKKAKAFVSKCDIGIQAASEFLEIQYAVNQSQRDLDGDFYKNGKGTLEFMSDVPLDDWVGFGGAYVTYTIPCSSIHFKLVNKGDEAIINPMVKFQFSGVILKDVYGEFEGEDYVNGISGYATAVLRSYENLAAGGSSSDYMLEMSEAYFENGSSGTVTITVSGDNYKARQYKVPLRLQ